MSSIDQKNFWIEICQAVEKTKGKEASIMMVTDTKIMPDNQDYLLEEEL